MKLIVASAFLCCTGLVWAQPVADKPVITVNGKKMTAADVEAFVSALPTAGKTAFQKDPKTVMGQYALMQLMAEMAVDKKLQDQEPYKGRLAYARNQILVQAMMEEGNKNFIILPEDQRKVYEQRKAKYTQATLKAIYIAFTTGLVKPADEKAKKVPTEAEAKAKADALYKQLQGGADFVKLVKENSDDPTSASKDGDFGVIKQSDGIPDEIKGTIFALKQGEVSKPVRQPNGFYLFKVTALEVEPYDKVKDDLFKELQQEAFKKWFDSMDAKKKVEFDDEAYFKSVQASAPAATSPAK